VAPDDELEEVLELLLVLLVLEAVLLEAVLLEAVLLKLAGVPEPLVLELLALPI
jgi:hypothetical protein